MNLSMSAQRTARRVPKARWAASAITAVVASSTIALAGTASAGTKPDFCGHDQRKGPGRAYLCARTGDIVDVQIGDVHPTQPSLGYDEVYYKLGRYTLGKDAVNKKFGDWCEASGLLDVVAAQPNARLDDPASFTCELAPGQETAESKALMKTVVIGPKGSLYLTDGHHTLTSLAEMPDGGLKTHIRLRVAGNLSSLTYQDFWAAMKANKWTWLQDPQGHAVKVNRLPKTVRLKNFQNDPYRSLLYFARDIGYTSGTVPFQEFYWGAWLRDAKAVDLSTGVPTDASSYLSAVEKVSAAQVALPKDELVHSGFTASQLGALKKVDTKEFGKLAKPYSDPKPGKVAYMEAYKELLAKR